MKTTVFFSGSDEKQKSPNSPANPASISGNQAPESPTEKIIRGEIRRLAENSDEIQKIKEQIEKRMKGNN